MNTSNKMRVWHRYLGFFLAGVMAVYALSGIVMIFRQTDFLKQEKQAERQLEANLKTEQLGEALRIRNFSADRTEGNMVYFEGGSYDASTGMAVVTVKELPFILDKFTKLHKATTNSPLYYFNILFGLGLLFFVISAFWMFIPSKSILRKGIYFTLGGILLVVLMLFI